jgi:hypothetical protein
VILRGRSKGGDEPWQISGFIIRTRGQPERPLVAPSGLQAVKSKGGHNNATLQQQMKILQYSETKQVKVKSSISAYDLETMPPERIMSKKPSLSIVAEDHVNMQI